MSSKNMVFGILPNVGSGALVVVVVGKAAPSGNEWDQYLIALKKLPQLDNMRTLVLTDGGGPDALQRKQLVELMNGKASLTCMISGSTIVRGVTTALSWFNPQIKAMSPERLDEGLGYLNVPRDQLATVWQEVQRLRQQVDLLPIPTKKAANQ